MAPPAPPSAGLCGCVSGDQPRLSEGVLQPKDLRNRRRGRWSRKLSFPCSVRQALQDPGCCPAASRTLRCVASLLAVGVDSGVPKSKVHETKLMCCGAGGNNSLRVRSQEKLLDKTGKLSQRTDKSSRNGRCSPSQPGCPRKQLPPCADQPPKSGPSLGTLSTEFCLSEQKTDSSPLSFACCQRGGSWEAKPLPREWPCLCRCSDGPWRPDHALRGKRGQEGETPAGATPVRSAVEGEPCPASTEESLPLLRLTTSQVLL